jgi:hypothetical protein
MSWRIIRKKYKYGDKRLTIWIEDANSFEPMYAATENPANVPDVGSYTLDAALSYFD